MNDDSLGMNRPIDRRDFLDGVALVIGAAVTGGIAAPVGAAPAAQSIAGYYPPLLTGLRGSHPGSFEAAHAIRDGAQPAAANPTGESYDLIVVGGGISGLAAAKFFRAANPEARVLILDNHDDFGGHAKRNEFWLGGKLHLMNGGTMGIDSPRPYSKVAAGLLSSLGVDPVALTAAHLKPDAYPETATGLFLDAKALAAAGVTRDTLVTGVPGGSDAAKWTEFLARTPFDATTRSDVLRIHTGTTDYLAGQSDAAKKDRLSRISYRDYLADVAKVGPGALALFQTRTQGEWCAGIDSVSALDAWGFGLPGFAGLKLVPKAHPRMSFTPAGYVEGGSDTFHFPDGNASIARLLVRDLIPGSIPGTGAESIVAARVDYGRLDRPENAVRLRLNSIVTNVRHAGGGTTGPVVVGWTSGGKAQSATGKAVVMACWNMMIAHLVPDLPAKQAAALHELVKGPLVYTTVAVANREPFAKLGVRRISAPGSYFTSVSLNAPVDIGGVTAERDPSKPILLFMSRTPCSPGLPEHDQNRAGRAELLATDFATFEHEIRGQLGAMLGPSGFDPARDITGITVNRWPHGYAPEYNFLWQPDVPVAERPHIVGRARFGRIAIANADSGDGAYTDIAIDQAWRAVQELQG